MSKYKSYFNVKNIQTISTEKAHSLYGEILPDIVEKRLKLELKHIKDNDLSVFYNRCYFAANHAHDNGQLTTALGDIGSSLVAFLLDITNVNPLPPHYICCNCNYNEFINEPKVYSCYDLPKKTCPVCGKALYCDGHNIPYETLIGYDGKKQPNIRLCYPMYFKENMPQDISNVNILDYVPLEMLLLLEKHTGISYKNVNFNDPKIYELFSNSRVIGIDSDEPATIGIPEFGTEFVRNIIKEIKPANFGDLIRIIGLTHANKVWFKTAKKLLANNICDFRDLPSSNEDIYNNLINNGIEKNIALKIAYTANKRLFAKSGLENNLEIIQAFNNRNISEWYINSLSVTRDMLPKAHSIEFLKLSLAFAWYKIYYPIEFYTVAFNTTYLEDSIRISLLTECINRGILVNRNQNNHKIILEKILP